MVLAWSVLGDQMIMVSVLALSSRFDGLHPLNLHFIP